MKRLFFVFFIYLFFIIPVFAEEFNEKTNMPSEVGRVLSVETFGEIKLSQQGELNPIEQFVEIEVIKGLHKGQKTIVKNMLMGNPAYDIQLKRGNKVILHVEQNKTGELIFFIADKYRVNVLYTLLGLFFLLLVGVGKKKGFYSLISILITLALIFWGLTPLILAGVHPIFATVFICILASIIAIYLVGGLNAKSSGAIIGTVLNLIFAGSLSALSIKFASLTGFSSEESLFLFSAHPNLNFVGVLASAMIIGALGAVMDIGMSISSTINELFESNKNLSSKELFESGMNVGRDIIGTMANTLILAYLGGALSLVLLSNNIDLQKFFNLNQVATEISSALIGSIAIVICVPITAIISSFLIKKFTKRSIVEKVFSDIIK